LRPPDDIVNACCYQLEVLRFGREFIALKGVSALNPAFDATSPRYISVIVTEKGVIHPHSAGLSGSY
jgi:methylthioribose-1-phosphate isomerase